MSKPKKGEQKEERIPLRVELFRRPHTSAGGGLWCFSITQQGKSKPIIVRTGYELTQEFCEAQARLAAVKLRALGIVDDIAWLAHIRRNRIRRARLQLASLGRPAWSKTGDIVSDSRKSASRHQDDPRMEA